jgi:hypothetical protein
MPEGLALNPSGHHFCHAKATPLPRLRTSSRLLSLAPSIWLDCLSLWTSLPGRGRQEQCPVLAGVLEDVLGAGNSFNRIIILISASLATRIFSMLKGFQDQSL